MLRRSVRALEVLVEQQSAQQSAMLLARNSMAQASKQVWRRPAARGIPSSSSATTARPFQSSSSTTLFSRTAPRRTFHSSRARRSQEGKAGEAKAGETGHTVAPEKLSLSQRIKKLSKEYGWTAVGVYFGLSLLDFPFCFLLVRTLGTDRIGMPTLSLFIKMSTANTHSRCRRIRCRPRQDGHPRERQGALPQVPRGPKGGQEGVGC